MKNYLFLVFFLAASLQAAAQVTSLNSADSVSIVTLMKDQEDAWNKGDIDEFMEGYWKSDNLVFVGGSGAAYGWETTRKGYHRRYPDRETMGELTFTILQMDALGADHARILGKFHLKRAMGDANGTFTLLFFRFPDGWKIISDHTSSLQ